MSQPFPHLWSAVSGQPWAIVKSDLETIVAVLQRRMEGVRLSPGEIAELKGRREPHGVLSFVPVAFDDEPIPSQENGLVILAGSGQTVDASPNATKIAVMNIMGIIANRISMVDDISGPGGTSTERVSQSLAQAAADPTVKSAVLKMDSPGGGVFGVQELAQQISDFPKPIVAQIDGQCCSAAYWLAAACDEIVSSPSSLVGSIGVFSVHQDLSAAAEKAGVKTTFIASSPEKVEGNEFQPLSDPAQAAMQSMVDGYHSDFTNAVAKGRGVTQAKVNSDFGKGRALRAGDALKAGMVDRIGTMDATLKRMGAAKPVTPAKAATEASQPDAIITAPPAASAEVGTEQAHENLAENPAVVQSAQERDAFRKRAHQRRLRFA